MNHRPILILVLSYDDKAEYSALMKAQQETWDTIDEPFVKTIYYTGGKEFTSKPIHPWSMQNTYPASDDYYEMHWKFKLCLDHIMNFPIPQFIFRTNSSSYVNKKELVKWVKTLPEEKVYAGFQNGDFISGAGIAMSPDVCRILIDELREGERPEEDILISRIMKRYGIGMIDDKTRYDVREFHNPPLDRFHYRFKTPSRETDVENMYRLHELIKDKQ